MRTIKSQQALADFRKRRRHAEQITGLKLYAGAKSIRNLAEHTKTFHKAVKDDKVKASGETVRSVTKEFEKELHAEVDKVISQTKADIMTLQKTLEEWVEVKKTLRGNDAQGKDERYAAILETERKYAEVLTSSMGHRLDALNGSFHRIRKR